jgi:hypothetical protein
MSQTQMKQTFETRLIATGPGGAWTYISIPFDVLQVFGTKARVPVAGTINGFAFRSSLMPEGDGTHRMMVGKELKAGAKASAGDVVRVTLHRDDEARPFEVPPELELALKGNRQAASFFASLTSSQKKDYSDWIGAARQETTRSSRADKAIEMLVAGKKRTR